MDEGSVDRPTRSTCTLRETGGAAADDVAASERRTASVERWRLWKGGACGKVASVEGRLLWKGGFCGRVASL